MKIITSFIMVNIGLNYLNVPIAHGTCEQVKVIKSINGAGVRTLTNIRLKRAFSFCGRGLLFAIPLPGN